MPDVQNNYSKTRCSLMCCSLVKSALSMRDSAFGTRCWASWYMLTEIRRLVTTIEALEMERPFLFCLESFYRGYAPFLYFTNTYSTLQWALAKKAQKIPYFIRYQSRWKFSWASFVQGYPAAVVRAVTQTVRCCSFYATAVHYKVYCFSA